ncbi:MAG TPA: zinc dependent phospholipase C family protein [Vicinamibacterales bacterium]|nr:zinc dependent phospholipase C family protein [Vicinamibacterales bacterium]
MGKVGTSLAVAALLLISTSAPVCGYSVLAHEAVIDANWTDQLAPLLRQRFPGVSAEAVRKARAYAYGGSLIQDLGYYPFGSHFFTNLVHYVRTGDFVDALIRDARTVDELAFALGALAHYTSDNAAHPIAVNRSVPIIYPKVRAKYGDEVLFSDSPARHVMVEFAFDVLQVARGTFKADAYQALIGFEVARPLLERAFRETYGLELKDVFGSVDLAIGTYRHAASQTIPDVTRVAWREKRDEILAATPDVAERDVVYTMTRADYEREFGTTYRKPSLFARFVVTIFKVLPKFGPFRPLAFEPLNTETERMFLESFAASSRRYRSLLADFREGHLSLSDTDLDTGRRPMRDVNPLADKTYEQLRKKLAKKNPGISPELRRALDAQYAAPSRATKGGETK